MKKQLALLLTCALLATGSVRADNVQTKRLLLALSDPSQCHSAPRYFTAVPRLLFNGANPCVNAGDGLAAIHHAAKRGLHDDIFQEILNTIKLKGWDIDFKDAEGWSALCHAAANNHCAAIELLISNGAKIDYSTTEGWYTPLHLAVFNGSTDAARKLVALGAKKIGDQRRRDPDSYTRRASVEFPGNRTKLFEKREELQAILAEATS